MAHLFATPGMTVLTLVMLALQAKSLIFMGLILYEYRHIHQKRVDMMMKLDGQIVGIELRKRLVLMLMYFLATVSMCCIVTYLYAFRPHLL